MIKVKVFTFNLFSENTIVLWDDETKEAAVIDPGTSTLAEENLFSDFIASENLKVNYLINTHCHIDHILGCKFVKEKYSPVYYAPEKDIPLLENAQQLLQFCLVLLELADPRRGGPAEVAVVLGVAGEVGRVVSGQESLQGVAQGQLVVLAKGLGELGLLTGLVSGD